MGQAQGRDLPFDIGDSHSCLSGKTIWIAHDGRRKVDEYARILSYVCGTLTDHVSVVHNVVQSDGEPVTVFVYNFTGKTEEEVKHCFACSSCTFCVLQCA